MCVDHLRRKCVFSVYAICDGPNEMVEVATRRNGEHNSSAKGSRDVETETETEIVRESERGR